MDLRVRHPGVQGHRRGPARRRLLLARRVPVRRRRPRPPRRRRVEIDRRRLAVPRQGPGPQGLSGDGLLRRQAQPADAKVQGRLHLPEPARLRQGHRLRAAQQGAGAGRRTVDDETGRVLAAADPAQPGVDHPARRFGGPRPRSPNTTGAVGVPVARTCTGTAPGIPPRTSAPNPSTSLTPPNSPNCWARRPMQSWRRCANGETGWA